MTHPIYPCLWFNGEAMAAAAFYCSVFSDAEITSENTVVVTFTLGNQKFMALNGGPKFTVNPSISFYVNFDNTSALEMAWHKLIEGGTVLMPLDAYPWSNKYGWVQDKYGVSWQLSLNQSNQGIVITPMLMFTGIQHGRTAEALEFYSTVFTPSSVFSVEKYGDGEQDPDWTIKHAKFKLGKTSFMAMDSVAAHNFVFNEALSFVVECDTQEEIDFYWNRLTAEGGEESMCGWLKDRFGISWQIVPSILGTLLQDPERAEKVTAAFLQMKKMDIAAILEA